MVSYGQEPWLVRFCDRRRAPMPRNFRHYARRAREPSRRWRRVSPGSSRRAINPRACACVRAPRVLGSDSDENIWAPGARVSASTMDHKRLQSPLPYRVITSWLNRSRPAIQPQHAAKNVLARLRSERDADKGSPSGQLSAISAVIMARPDKPKMSEATTDSLRQASSRG